MATLKEASTLPARRRCQAPCEVGHMLWSERLTRCNRAFERASSGMEGVVSTSFFSSPIQGMGRGVSLALESSEEDVVQHSSGTFLEGEARSTSSPPVVAGRFHRPLGNEPYPPPWPRRRGLAGDAKIVVSKSGTDLLLDLLPSLDVGSGSPVDGCRVEWIGRNVGSGTCYRVSDHLLLFWGPSGFLLQLHVHDAVCEPDHQTVQARMPS